MHNPTVCAVKATDEELRALGTELGEKAAKAKGPTQILLPLGGLDKYEAAGGPWESQKSDRVLFDAIHAAADGKVPVRELPGNINDPIFSEATVQAFLELWEHQRSEANG